jgi:RNA polymerase sigma factor (sigma-70 family)
MHSRDELAHRFQAQRGHLHEVAYRMLGSASEAEDAVQETWLRLERADVSEVQNLAAWLRTVVSRVCLDMLRSRAARREDLLGQQVPAASPAPSPDGEPEQEAILADSVGRALLVVLDTLGPAERIAFVLHDHVRGAVRRDRPGRGPHPGQHEEAGQPGAAAGPGHAHSQRRGTGPAPAGGRGLSRRVTGGRRRGGARGAGPGRAAPGRPGRPASGPGRRGPRCAR